MLHAAKSLAQNAKGECDVLVPIASREGTSPGQKRSANMLQTRVIVCAV